MERHWALTWHRRNHQAMRTYVQLDLGRQAGAGNQNDEITLDDARYLVAREHGFERWDALVKFYTSVPVQPSLITAKSIGLFAAEAVSDESPAWDSRDWSAVVSRLKERDATGIDAAGQMTDAMIRGRVTHRTRHGASARRVSRCHRRWCASPRAVVAAAIPRPEWHQYHGSGTRGSAGAARAGDGLTRPGPRSRTPGSRNLSGCGGLSNVESAGHSIRGRCPPCARWEGSTVSTANRQCA